MTAALARWTAVDNRRAAVQRPKASTSGLSAKAASVASKCLASVLVAIALATLPAL
jgi:hypothetical protein